MSRRFRATWIFAVSLLLLLSASRVHANSVTTLLTPFAGSDVEVELILSEIDGDIHGRLEVMMGIGDLRGLFLNVDDMDILEGLWVSGDDVTRFATGQVIDLGEGNNVYGGGTPCPCDIGISFGTPGIGMDDIGLTEFVVSSELGDLSLSIFSGLSVAARVTSVGDEESGREGSAKLIGVVPEPSTALLLMFQSLGLAGLAARRRCLN